MTQLRVNLGMYVISDPGRWGDPVGIKNDGDDGDVGCGDLGGANAETDKGEDGTPEKAVEGVSGKNGLHVKRR